MVKYYVGILKDLITKGQLTPDDPIVNEVKEKLIEISSQMIGYGKGSLIEAEIEKIFADELHYLKIGK